MTAPTSAQRGVRPRCAVHPSRPAVDACPVCDRPRCGADAAAVSIGCLGCAGDAVAEVSTVRPPGDLERLVRAALAAYVVGLVGGLVASEYVGATVFAYLGPFVVGVTCGGAATRAARTDGRGLLGTRVRTVGAVLAVLGIALSFVVEGSLGVLELSPDVLLPYAAAVAGALLWTMPPRPRKSQGQGASTDV
ncbi:MAG: hypothetical protein JJD92_15725 [Frankiaceae bacterium]|nr:hypothetical protein [Frankiaceae bacterium]